MNNQNPIVWIFTFEYEGVIKVGGLGEVPANQVKSLSNKFNFTIFMPSNGQIDNLKKKWLYDKLSIKCTGEINPSKLGLKDNNVKNYEIGFYQFYSDHGKIILISGENDFSKKYLGDPSPYNPETFKGKVALYSFGINCYISHLFSDKSAILPDLVHLHDYHVVIPFISMKQVLFKNNIHIPSLITIHLLTWPRYELSFLRACGIDDTQITLRLPSGLKSMKIREIFDLCTGDDKIQVPLLEKVGATICDMVITVSESYLNSDIIPYLGNDLIKFKANFVWNGCDWVYDDIYSDVIDKMGEEIKNVLDLDSDVIISRDDLKKYLLTYKLGHLSSPPVINSTKIINHIKELAQGDVISNDRSVKPFKTSGPLAIATGRISPQKGIDIILEGIPRITQEVPDAKFLLLLLPTEYSLEQITNYFSYIRDYKKNLRIIFGKAFELFYLSHLSADIYCAISRWEPFGITALEAMAAKIPLIATKVGGLQETMIDIRENPEKGTGLLIEKENVDDFSNGVISLFKLAKLDNQINQSSQIRSKLMQEIPDPKIRDLNQKYINYYEKIRENCYNRVEKYFRWKEVSKKLERLYNQIINLYNQK
ncbi:MAG: glycosyltransferase [Promethearchaeota archaeon]|nr:MAG: glycosyltransferase [Candidatus Lokiarchaeota archaeon]